MTQSTTRQWSTEKLLLVIGMIAIVAGIAIGASVGYAVRYEAATTTTTRRPNTSSCWAKKSNKNASAERSSNTAVERSGPNLRHWPPRHILRQLLRGLLRKPMVRDGRNLRLHRGGHSGKL